MWTPVQSQQLAELPVGELATAAVPDRWHGALQAMGTHCRNGSWVVSGPQGVSTALASSALSVVPPDSGGQPGPAARLVARMARFSDGTAHASRRELVMRLLPPVPEVARIAGTRANDYLRRRAAPFDIMPMARSLPAEVLARAVGLPPAEAAHAAALTGALSDALAPSLLPWRGTGRDPDSVAVELTDLVAGVTKPDDDDNAVAIISILFQARDATAALIGTAVLAGCRVAIAASRPAGGIPAARRTPAQQVEHVLRNDAPVQCTRRTALTDVAIGASVIPAGTPVWIFVATAERGAGVPATFGMGPHGCPGAAHASAIARQVVTVLEADSWQPVAGQRIDLEPRPNIRMPSRVLVARA